jgi:RND family efflux transporter MFP subunit
MNKPAHLKYTRNLRLATLLIAGAASMLCGCEQGKSADGAGAATGAPGPLPVQTITVQAQRVAQADEYVATIKSRRSATINPQVGGNLTMIAVHSGEHVKQGQLLMQIDPQRQQATVDSQAATEQQKLAVYQYNQAEVERQRKLFEGGITSRSSYDQAQQAFANAKADYESNVALRKSQQHELNYYRIVAPFDGIVGDVPAHVGDYVSSTTVLTTIDENRDLEAYIYVPTERASLLRTGLAVDILNSAGEPVERTAIDFLSPQVDNGLQGILAKAPVRSSGVSLLRTAQLVKARVIWSDKPTPVVPVLAVTRLGGQAFVYVAQRGPGSGGNGPAGAGKDSSADGYIARQTAVQLGDTVGNNYAVTGGLSNGEQVIVSGTQMLVDGAPVRPIQGQANRPVS